MADESLQRLELYNLSRDRHELLDMAAQEPEVLAGLVAKLEVIAGSVQADPLRPKWVQENREGD